ncbi:MAG TPA: WYL domain-containing transcriptional regulator [Epsilonproteobacteria bacterium]|nr:WYL domain-containing transcriptional regulator [Campylobacterota bacterium]
MSQKSSLHRTIEMLKHLNEGKQLCVTRLAEEYGVSDRTIRRDFELIRELFGDFMSKEGECYRAYKKVLLDEVLHATDLMTLANIVNLFGVTQKQSLISDKTQALIDKSMLVYDFKSRPFENMQNHEVIKKLEHAIKFNKEIQIRYKSERSVSHTNFKPYKILFLNENFYMVGENSSKHNFEFRRIAMIEEVSYKNRTFTAHKDITEFIKTIQTPWANFGQSNKVVQLRVNKKIRRFFIFKKYLPSQTVTKTYDNGDILVEYTVTNYHELEELIIKWLPNIEIVSPRNLKKMIKHTLKQKFSSIN